MEVTLRNGGSVHLPAASQGGTEGRVVHVSSFPAFHSVVDSLIRTGARFALRARIRTLGGDADETDNSKVREMGRWRAMVPGEELAMGIGFSAYPGGPTRVRLDTLGLPAGSTVSYRPGDPSALPHGYYATEVRFRSPQQLPLGSVVAFRVTLSDAHSGEVVQQQERIAVFDTLPPMLSNYRAVLLRDRRIAIQVQAGDQHSGVPEHGVSTHYSLDGGTTWHHQVHAFVEDDFGRPAMFEAILGPFSHRDRLLVGINAQDMAGNVSNSIPIDATVFAAPYLADALVDSFKVGSGPEGNPIFAPEMIARRARWVQVGQAKAALLPPREQSTLSERFEMRRLHQLDSVPSFLRAQRVDLSRFIRLTSPLRSYSAEGGTVSTVLRIGPLP